MDMQTKSLESIWLYIEWVHVLIIDFTSQRSSEMVLILILELFNNNNIISNKQINR